MTKVRMCYSSKYGHLTPAGSSKQHYRKMLNPRLALINRSFADPILVETDGRVRYDNSERMFRGCLSSENRPKSEISGVNSSVGKEFSTEQDTKSVSSSNGY